MERIGGLAQRVYARLNMIRYFTRTYRTYRDAPREKIKESALVVAVILNLIGGVLYFSWHSRIGIDPQLWLFTLILGLIAVTGPQALRIPYATWMVFAETVGYINSRIVLGILFYAIFTPLSFFFSMIQRDALRRSFDASSATYKEKSAVRSARDHMRFPF